MDYPGDEQFSEAALWLHSAGQMAQLAAFSGNEKFKLLSLNDLRRAANHLGFELIAARSEVPA